MKNIYLIGMMGSGKTTTGKALAKLLSISFVDLDDQIVERVGKSINDIFATEGESYFRTVESELLLETSGGRDQVVATGGGIVLNAANRERMKNTGVVIYLKTSLNVLWDRVKSKTDRPLLRGRDPQETLAALFRDREPLYEAGADKSFLTNGKSPESVAVEIYKACFEKK